MCVCVCVRLCYGIGYVIFGGLTKESVGRHEKKRKRKIELNEKKKRK